MKRKKIESFSKEKIITCRNRFLLPVSSEIPYRCEISDLFLYVIYFTFQSERMN